MKTKNCISDTILKDVFDSAPRLLGALQLPKNFKCMGWIVLGPFSPPPHGPLKTQFPKPSPKKSAKKWPPSPSTHTPQRTHSRISWGCQKNMLVQMSTTPHPLYPHLPPPPPPPCTPFIHTSPFTLLHPLAFTVTVLPSSPSLSPFPFTSYASLSFVLMLLFTPFLYPFLSHSYPTYCIRPSFLTLS